MILNRWDIQEIDQNARLDWGASSWGPQKKLAELLICTSLAIWIDGAELGQKPLV
jgi:hypothetical protein